MTVHHNQIAIIGAGVAGITAALRLQATGLSCTILEKSRGVGGRLATRRTRDGLHFDHGAQYFTARSPDFRSALEQSPWAGHVDDWQAAHPAGDPEVRFVGTPAMKAPLRAAASDLDIHLGATVDRIERTEAGWRLRGDGVAEVTADYLLISAPAPQAMALTPFSPRLQDRLAQMRYDPCWALMVAFDDPVSSTSAVFRPDHGPFSWIARNSSKPGRDVKPETWVAHASPDWSRTHLENDKDHVAQKLLADFLTSINAPERTPAYIAAHRWRYARVATALDEPFLADETGQLLIIGDGCLGPRVECAFESGHQAAEHILSRL